MSVDRVDCEEQVERDDEVVPDRDPEPDVQVESVPDPDPDPDVEVELLPDPDVPVELVPDPEPEVDVPVESVPDRGPEPEPDPEPEEELEPLPGREVLLEQVPGRDVELEVLVPGRDRPLELGGCEPPGVLLPGAVLGRRRRGSSSGIDGSIDGSIGSLGSRSAASTNSSMPFICCPFSWRPRSCNGTRFTMTW